jgi:hypothetical protein
VHTEFSRFVVFLSGSSLCLAYLAATLVNSGVVRWGEDGTMTVAYFCIMLMFLDLWRIELNHEPGKPHS